MSSKIKVCVGIPQPEQTDYRFQNSLWDLLLSNASSIEMSRTNAIGSVISKNRNMLVESAQAWGATHILQIDSDQTFPANGLPRLLAYDKDIVCATTSRRMGEDRSPVAEPADRNTLTPYQKLVPMKLVGFPFMLIKMSVFEKMRKPYFADPPRWMMDPNQPDADDLVQEDEYFCMRATEAGFEVLCDMELSMEIGHVGSTVYYIKNPNDA